MTRDKQFYRTIFRIALPVAFQSMISFLVVLADDIMVSSMPNGVVAQAAVSQVNAVTAFYTATLLGLVSGSGVLISQYWGKQDKKRIKMIFSIVTMVCMAVSALFVLLLVLFPNTVIGMVVKAKELQTVNMAKEYMAIACFSYLPFAITAALTGMLRAMEVVRVTLYASIVSLLTNVGLNYVLIFGKLGMPAMGVQGAAIATLIARIVELVIVWLYAFKVQKAIEIKPRDLVRTEKWVIRDYIRYGLPVGITDMQWSLVGMLKAVIIGQMGTMFAAANSIASAMANLGTMFTFALAGGASVVVGKAVGAGEYDKAREYSKTIQIMFFFIGLIMAAVVYLLGTPFTMLYGSAKNPEVFSLSTAMISLLALTLVGTSYHASCFVGINRGAGDSRFVAMVDMICGWVIVLPVTALAAFVFKAPLPIVFLCTRIDQCFKWIIAFLRLRGNKWIKNVTRSGEVTSA
jgi:putative MATE family efflux protein